jgi:hypothetical protein
VPVERFDRSFTFRRSAMILFQDNQDIYYYKLQMKPRYEAWDDEIGDTNAIGDSPSLGIGAEW